MSRTALKILAFSIVLGGAVAALAVSGNPHVDSGLMPGACRSCHEGHGTSGSPMLPTGQQEMCFQCHGSPGRLQAMVARGLVSGSARPAKAADGPTASASSSSMLR